MAFSEPIALVGSSCRFAGGINSPHDLHAFYHDSSAKDLSCPPPHGRFSIQGFYHKEAEYHGTTNSPKAYWLDQDHRVFDAQFFNITPKEAEAIDPQQRMLLEVVYEALESAGYSLKQYAGQNVAVFAGVMTGDYDMLTGRDDLNSSQYVATGTARSIISNRLSYFFDFHGPSMTIDTACSASLVALHQAIQSVRSGESPMACVTGVNLMLTPEQFMAESNLHMLSPTGHSRMWDAKADGYARGEGVAAVLIKTLSRALADGDNIQAIIRETGVNSDGRSRGITMPNPNAQATLIRETYRKSGLDPTNPDHQPQYFEAHGTGTPVGDPLEARAIREAFFGSVATESSQPNVNRDGTSISPSLLVGSVKTVIGHTEGAAGLAGLLKVVQSLKEREVLPNKHFDTLNPKIAPFYDRLEIETQILPWPTPPTGQPARASVNSFGFGGANAFAIVERYEPSLHDALAKQFHSKSSTRSSHIREQKCARVSNTEVRSKLVLPLLFSAANQKSLLDTLKLYRDHLHTEDECIVSKTAWHLYKHRTAHQFRVATVVANDPLLAREALTSLIMEAEDLLARGGKVGTRDQVTSGRPKILGVFTGQGAQYAEMSKGFFETNSVYRDSIRAMDEVLQACPEPPAWRIEEQLLVAGSQSQLSLAAISQPLCTALQVALVDLLTSINVSFHCVVGHSSGEIAAAYAAGRISRHDAILIAYYRGRFAHLASGRDGGKGAMLSCALSKQQAEDFCARPEYDGRLCVAAGNSPTLVTLSGDLDAVISAVDALKDQNTFARQLNVDTAYHSFHMLRSVEAYSQALVNCKIRPSGPQVHVQWISSVYGSTEKVSSEDLALKYWGDNMIKPVLFEEALRVALRECGTFDCAIEIGPHPALKGPAMETIQSAMGHKISYIGLLQRGMEAGVAFAEFLGKMWTHFGPGSVTIQPYVESSPYPQLTKSFLQNAPSYPWDHSQIYWRESRLSEQHHFRREAPHELLGVRTRDDNQHQLRWRNILKVEKLPWMTGHKFQGQVLLPASAYCVMAVDAAKVLLDGRPGSIVELQGLEFLSGITVEQDSLGVETLFSLSLVPTQNADQAGILAAEFNLTSVPVKPYGFNPMKMNFRGRMHITLHDELSQPLPGRRQEARAETLPVKVESFYTMMEGIGLEYTGPFRALQTIDRRLDYAEATLVDRQVPDSTSLAISPAILDSCFQVAFATFSSPGDRALWTPFLPTNIGSIRFDFSAYSSGMDSDEKSVECHLTKFEPYTKRSAATISADMSIFNGRGDTLIQVEDLTVSSFASTKPHDDYELYLHTVLDVDPNDGIAEAPAPAGRLELNPGLVESCERVAQYYSNYTQRQSLPDTPPVSPTLWSVLHQEDYLKATRSLESDTAMDQFIASSPYSSTLKAIREASKNNPGALPRIFPMVVQQGQRLLNVQKHLARVVRQVSHRYPRMDVLDLTDPDSNFTKHILDGLRGSRSSLSIGRGHIDSLEEELRTISGAEKVAVLPLDSERDRFGGLDNIERQDLVILSFSSRGDFESSQMHSRVQNIVKLGGFCILVISPDMLRGDRCGMPITGEDNCESASTPPHCDSCDQSLAGSTEMRTCMTHETLFDLTLSVRRDTGDTSLAKCWDPEGWEDVKLATRHLLLIGGQTPAVGSVQTELKQLLMAHCNIISTTDSLDQVTPEIAASCTAIIFLLDLEEPVCPSITDDRLKILKSLIRPDLVVLWVTCQARYDPDKAASLGLTRTWMAETPYLTIQVLDLEDAKGSTSLIADSFRQLCYEVTAPQTGETTKEALWCHEPEIHIENGKRLIPRVLPYQPANDRLNAYRREVSNVVNTLETCVLLEPSYTSEGATQYQSRNVGDAGSCFGFIPGTILLRVEYSTGHPVTVGSLGPMYVCIGRVVDTGDLKVGLSNDLASVIQVQTLFTIDVSSVHCDLGHVAALIAQLIWVYNTMMTVDKADLVLVEPDAMLSRCVQRVVLEQFPEMFKLRVCTTEEDTQLADRSTKFLSPWSTAREVRNTLPGTDCVIYDFLPQGSRLSRLVSSLRLEGVEYHHVSSGNCTGGNNDGYTLVIPGADEYIWETAVRRAMKEMMQLSLDMDEISLVTPTKLIETAYPMTLATVIDWKADRRININIKPVLPSCSLRPDRTYILVGLTRDLGQSICRLFIKHGARHIVVASRNPNTSPAWVSELNSQGADIRVECLDVTILDDVEHFHERILSSAMPLVGGLVNGAMILNDRIFAQMDAATWHRVLGPKTIGSKNLDTVFGSSDLDFFVMTSSFAAIGGHAGQTNYAAANMYMNGLAAQRRRRGLAGSVLNIGVIYGLGLLARETRQDTYGALERDGYPPISERDLHHMFIEAIEAGRPVAGQVNDLTTGLARFRVNDPNPQHWHRDRRFCHFTVSQSHEEMETALLQGNSQQATLKSLVAAAKTAQTLQDVLVIALCRRMEVTLQLLENTISAHSSTADLGVDSLAAVEIRNWFYTLIGADVPVMVILGATSISSLCRGVADKMLKQQADSSA